MAVIRHLDSWVESHELGTKRPYLPTYSESLTLGPTHRRLLEAPLKPGSVAIDIGIPGSLRREDAGKLYELAYFGQGDVCVLGSSHGLASAIIAQALYDADRPGAVVGVDVEPRLATRGRANLAAYGLDHKAEFVQETPLSFCNSRAAQGRSFGFMFVDHSSNYADVLAVSVLLPSLLD